MCDSNMLFDTWLCSKDGVVGKLLGTKRSKSGVVREGRR